MKDGVFGEIYAFEPESRNADALSKRVERLKSEWNIAENRIHIIRGAAGKEDGKLFVTNDVGGFAAKIKKHKPLLAICIYHQSADLYKISIFIKRLNEDYRIDIAHHYYDYSETVLYAY